MKLIIALVVAVLLTACSSMNPQLRRALSFGEIVELNEFSPQVEKQLLLRLFSAPVYKDNCFKETNGVCKYQYFLSVSSYDEFPETNIYALEATGELREVNWLESTLVDTVSLELKIASYTKEAANNNEELSQKTSKLTINVTPRDIKQSLGVTD